jgi:hypothetical protein
MHAAAELLFFNDVASETAIICQPLSTNVQYLCLLSPSLACQRTPAMPASFVRAKSANNEQSAAAPPL